MSELRRIGSNNKLSDSNGQILTEEDLLRECGAYNEHINNVLGVTPKPIDALANYLPLPTKDGSLVLFERLRDGILLAYLVNSTQQMKMLPNLIDLRKLATKIDMQSNRSKFEACGNLKTDLDAASKVIGKIVNIGAEDIFDMTHDLVLGLVWRLVRCHLTSSVNILSHPELVRLLEPNESLPMLIELPPEVILQRWFNYHLKRSGLSKPISNLNKDLCDSNAYIALLRQISPRNTNFDKLEAASKLGFSTVSEKEERARLVLETAETIQSRKFATAKDIAGGHKRLNFGFVATLFNNHIGIRLPTEEEINEMYSQIESLEERERANAAKLAQLMTDLKALEERTADHAKEMTDSLSKKSLDGQQKLTQQKQKDSALKAEIKLIDSDLEAAGKELLKFVSSQFEKEGLIPPEGLDWVGKLKWLIDELIDEHQKLIGKIASLEKKVESDKKYFPKMKEIANADISVEGSKKKK